LGGADVGAGVADGDHNAHIAIVVAVAFVLLVTHDEVVTGFAARSSNVI